MRVENKDKSKSQYSLLFFGRFGRNKKTNYNHHVNGLNMTDFSQSSWKKLIKNFYLQYPKIEDYIQIIFENKYENKFNYYNFSRIIDCLSALATDKGFGPRTKYQDVANEYLNIPLLEKIDEILFSIPGNNLGVKISNLRASIVHFGISEKPDIHIAYQVYPLLELIVIDYIFETISMPIKLRNKYKNYYSRAYLRI